MRLRHLALLACMMLVSASCSLSSGRTNAARSVAGSAAHGELVRVPSGTVDDWNIIVSPQQMGVEEAGSEADNRLIAFRVSVEVFDPVTWKVTALYRFGYAMDNENVHWVEGAANYLAVRR